MKTANPWLESTDVHFGALSAVIMEGCAPASLIRVETSAGFHPTAEENLAGRVAFRQGIGPKHRACSFGTAFWSDCLCRQTVRFF